MEKENVDEALVDTFEDLRGRIWRPRLRAPAIIKACEHTGLSIADLTTYQVPLGSILRLAWFACEKEARALEVDEEDFLDAMGPAQIKGAIACIFSIVRRDFGGGSGPLFDALGAAGGLDLGSSGTSSSSEPKPEPTQEPTT